MPLESLVRPESFLKLLAVQASPSEDRIELRDESHDREIGGRGILGQDTLAVVTKVLGLVLGD